MRITRASQAMVIAAMAISMAEACAQTTNVVTRNTTTSTTQPQSAATSSAGLSSADLELAKMWGLTSEEMRRAKLLLAGPRGTFSQPNLSPLEALGIHARTPAERQKYALAFARALHDDTERVLAWTRTVEQARRAAYGTERVIDFSGATDKPVVDPGIAAAARVPRSAYTPAPQKAAPARK